MLLPEHLIDFQAFDADLVRLLADPYHAGMSPLNSPLQQDHIPWPETMSGGMKARASGRDVEGADVSGASGIQKIHFKRNSNRATFFA